MRSPAAAIAWEFRQHHRWGWIALAGYLLVLATVRLLIFEPGQRVEFDDGESVAFVLAVPLTTTFLYFLAVFSYGLAGDLAARQSMYPARMFALPVTTTALAGWPMLYGTVAMALLWLATRLLAAWPSGVDVPMIWPALLAASMLAWLQALTWMPYPLPGLRVIVTVLWLTVIDAIVFTAIEYQAPEGVMLALLAPHLPLAFLVARVAIARARRGDVPDWQGIFGQALKPSSPRFLRRDHFRSPARAQFWFEWRRHGWSLPALVGMVLPFELALLFGFSDTPVIVFETLLAVLLTPPFMAAFAAARVSQSNPHGHDAHGLAPFVSTRPLSSPSLIAAKLTATIWSAFAAWLLVLAAIPLALQFAGALPMVLDRARQGIDIVGTPRAIVIVLLVIAGLMAATWKQLVQGLYIGLTGREWAVKSSVFVTLSFLAVLGPLVHWIIDNGNVQAVLWDAIPSILAVLVGVKMSAAAWIAVRLYDSRLLSDRMLLTGAASWCVAVLALYGVLAWILSVPFLPRYLPALIAILAMPLVRLSAAPLALSWNRHR